MMCNIIINQDGEIVEISSQCINILHLNLKKLKKRALDITSIIPEFFEKIDEITTKLGRKTICLDASSRPKKFKALIKAE